MLIRNISADRYYITETTNARFHAFAYVQDRILRISLRTGLENGEQSKLLRGAEQFQRILKHFAGQFSKIQGNWSYGDNLDAFNQAIRSGLSPEQAALQTWTGRQAQLAGYSQVEWIELNGHPGFYTAVKINFLPRQDT